MSAEDQEFAALTASLMSQAAPPAQAEAAEPVQAEAETAPPEDTAPGQTQPEAEAALAEAEAAPAQAEAEPDWKQAAAKERERRAKVAQVKAENARLQQELQAAQAEQQRLQRVRERLNAGDIDALQELGTDYDNLTGAYIRAQDKSVKEAPNPVTQELEQLRQTVQSMKAEIEATKQEAAQRELQNFYTEIEVAAGKHDLELLKIADNGRQLVAALFVEAAKAQQPMTVEDACRRAEEFLQQRETTRLEKLKSTKKFQSLLGKEAPKPNPAPAKADSATLTPDLRRPDNHPGQIAGDEQAAFAATVQRIIKTHVPQ
jgi:archaellum component FlaC